MDKYSKDAWATKISNTHKKNIKEGKYTPKSSNYIHHTPIHFKVNDEYIIARSSWEVVYKLQNPTFIYEKIRLNYFDSNKSKWRIYITDFYDASTNTIIEIKPNVYVDMIRDKKKAVIDNGYNFLVISENYFKSNIDIDMISILENSVINYDKVKHRFNWVKKCLK